LSVSSITAVTVKAPKLRHVLQFHALRLALSVQYAVEDSQYSCFAVAAL